MLIVAELMKQLAGRHTRKSRLFISLLLKRSPNSHVMATHHQSTGVLHGERLFIYL
ncbi:MAG: hypothetical protein RIR92_1132 [Pseudomonadota bacterium]|jgi:hypothetical protein